MYILALKSITKSIKSTQCDIKHSQLLHEVSRSLGFKNYHHLKKERENDFFNDYKDINFKDIKDDFNYNSNVLIIMSKLPSCLNPFSGFLYSWSLKKILSHMKICIDVKESLYDDEMTPEFLKNQEILIKKSEIIIDRIQPIVNDLNFYNSNQYLPEEHPLYNAIILYDLILSARSLPSAFYINNAIWILTKCLEKFLSKNEASIIYDLCLVNEDDKQLL